jgi:hypothetical protein
MEFVMPIPLRDDFDAAQLRRAARQSKDSGEARRLLALAAIYDGSTRTDAAKIGGVTLQIVRDWVLKFNAHGPSGLIAGKAPGQTPRLTSEHRTALARMIEDGRSLPFTAWCVGPGTNPPPATRSSSARPVTTRGSGLDAPDRSSSGKGRPIAPLLATVPPTPSAAASSMIVFHSPHDSHLPCQRWVMAPQFWQT